MSNGSAACKGLVRTSSLGKLLLLWRRKRGKVGVDRDALESTGRIEDRTRALPQERPKVSADDLAGRPPERIRRHGRGEAGTAELRPRIERRSAGENQTAQNGLERL